MVTANVIPVQSNQAEVWPVHIEEDDAILIARLGKNQEIELNAWAIKVGPPENTVLGSP